MAHVALTWIFYQSSFLVMESKLKELFDRSKEARKGLTFYLNGQTVSCIVREVLEDGTVVGWNQSYDNIYIRRASIDAVAEH